jgi:ATP-dependent Clp protease protease subunit
VATAVPTTLQGKSMSLQRSSTPRFPVVANEPDEDAPAPAAPAGDAKAEAPRPDAMERLLKARVITISQPIDDKVATRVISELLMLEADDASKPITMFLNSPGGSVTSGFAIYDMMRFVAPPVRVICTGLCASIAVVILMGADKADRLALPNTRLLIHQPLIAGTVFGPASDLEITANELLKTRAKINELLAQETAQPLTRLEGDTQRDYWLTALEAVEYGLLARIVTNRADLG